jgi:Golgi nucleoside diphosphatase
MGGSSMQITYAPHTVAEKDKKYLFRQDIAGKTYYLYTHSFLQYGLQAAERLFQRVAMDLIEEKGNPCFPAKYKHSSTGSFNLCHEWIGNLVVDKAQPCPTSTCSFNGVYQPPIANEPFIAIENFFYTALFFGHSHSVNLERTALPNKNQLVASLKQRGLEYCNEEWPALLSKYTPKTPLQELSYYCFAAAYQANILEHGFGFTAESNIRPAKTIHGKALDWELGAVILEINNPSKGGSPSTLNAVTSSEESGVSGSCTYCWYIVALVLSVAGVGVYALTQRRQGALSLAQLQSQFNNQYKV